MLLYIASIVSFVMGLVVLIRLFQRKGILHGILGLICMIYTFIWGWMNAKKENLNTIMIVWTVIIVINIIIAVMGSSGG